MDNAELLSAVQALDGDIKPREKADRPAVSVPAAKLAEVARKLQSDPRFAFDMLSAHTAIDWPKEERFELIYQLYSTANRQWLMLSVSVPRAEPVAPSVAGVWAIAEWQEREVYDLFGVRYSGHPDLRRLFLEDDWVGHPLRKDYQDPFIVERPW